MAEAQYARDQATPALVCRTGTSREVPGSSPYPTPLQVLCRPRTPSRRFPGATGVGLNAAPAVREAGGSPGLPKVGSRGRPFPPATHACQTDVVIGWSARRTRSVWGRRLGSPAAKRQPSHAVPGTSARSADTATDTPAARTTARSRQSRARLERGREVRHGERDDDRAFDHPPGPPRERSPENVRVRRRGDGARQTAADVSCRSTRRRLSRSARP
jgi:hypothetical protein